MVVVFLLYQIAILECTELFINYFLMRYAEIQRFRRYLKKKFKDLFCETSIPIAYQMRKLLSVKDAAFFIQENPWCECEK